MDCGFYRIEDGQQLGQFEMSATIEEIAFSNDGKLMAGASWDHSVKVLSFPDLREVWHLHGHLGSVYHVAFTADNRLLTGAEDGQTVLWDLRTGLEMMRFNYRYCWTLQDGTWIFGGQLHPRTGELDLHLVPAL